MGYIQSTLSKDEVIKETAHLHWINYAVVFMCAFLCIGSCALLFKYNPSENAIFAVLFGFPAVVFFLSSILAYCRIQTTEMVVTNKRVICRTGVVSVHTEEIKSTRLESIEIKQSILGRILNYGSLWFSGTGTAKVLFPHINDPRGVKAKVEDFIID